MNELSREVWRIPILGITLFITISLLQSSAPRIVGAVIVFTAVAAVCLKWEESRRTIQTQFELFVESCNDRSPKLSPRQIEMLVLDGSERLSSDSSVENLSQVFELPMIPKTIIQPSVATMSQPFVLNFPASDDICKGQTTPESVSDGDSLPPSYDDVSVTYTDPPPAYQAVTNLSAASTPTSTEIGRDTTALQLTQQDRV